MSGPMGGPYVSVRYSPDDAASQPTIDPMTTTQAPEGVRALLRAVKYADMLNAARPDGEVRVPVHDFILDSELRDLARALSVPVNGQGSEPWGYAYRQTTFGGVRIAPEQEWKLLVLKTASEQVFIDDLKSQPERYETLPLYAAQQAPISDDTQAGDHDSPEKALGDAQQYGLGFIVDGRRVSPDRVTVCRGPDHDLEALREKVGLAGMLPVLPSYYTGSGTIAAFDAGKRAATDAILSTLQSKPGE